LPRYQVQASFVIEADTSDKADQEVFDLLAMREGFGEVQVSIIGEEGEASP
jgi:hypothetical protein